MTSYTVQSDTYCTSASQSPLNVWSHLAVTTSGLTGVFYFNGAVSSTVALALTARGATRPYGWIGHSLWANDGASYSYFDDIRIFNRALTAVEITSVYNFSG